MVTPIADTGETRTPYTVMNSVISVLDGFTPSGTFKSPYDYLIVRNGAVYSACNAFQVVYGGAIDVGGVDGADFEAVFKACLADGTTIILDGSGGNFEITSQSGLWLADSTGYGDLKNIQIFGVNGARLLYTYTAGEPISLFYLSDGWENTLVEGVIFDMNCTKAGVMPLFPDVSDTGVQWTSALGTAWIIGVTTHLGSNRTENVTFRNCHFLHSPDVGLNIAGAWHIHFENCLFDGFGEHLIYTGAAGGYDCLDLQFKSSVFLNWAKHYRGYFKLIDSNIILVDKCYFDPNRDGVGIGPLILGERGAYGPVIYRCQDTTVRDCYFLGDFTGLGNGYGAVYDVGDATTDNTVFENVTVVDWNSAVFNVGVTNTKVLGGKYVDTVFYNYGGLTLANKVQIVTAGVSTYYDYFSSTSATTLFHHGDVTVDLEDYASGTVHTNLDQTNPTMQMNLPADALPGTTYTIVSLLGTDNRIRLYPPTGGQLYFNATLQAADARIQNDNHNINDTVTAICCDALKWIIQSPTGGTWTAY